MPTSLTYSPLYARFNGYCLGAFLAGSQQSLAQPRYGAIRTRVHDFFNEIGVDIRLPARHDAFVGAYPALMPKIKAALSKRDSTLHLCCGLGEMAALYAGAYVGTTLVLRQQLRRKAVPELQRLGLGPLAFDSFVQGMARAARANDANALMTQVYLLLADLLQPLPAESDTCFIAMPFARPYASYFGQLYRPALQRAGFRAIRAWGGLVDEEYYPFIAPLIARCALVLADLSAHNLNVANEVGLAHGANCPAVLLMRSNSGPPPSNLGDLAVLRYDPHAADWPDIPVRSLAKFVRLHWRAYVDSLTHEHLIQSTAHRLVQMLRAAGQSTPQALLELARVQR